MDCDFWTGLSIGVASVLAFFATIVILDWLLDP